MGGAPYNQWWYGDGFQNHELEVSRQIQVECSLNRSRNIFW
jgi:hypothetical protein